MRCSPSPGSVQLALPIDAAMTRLAEPLEVVQVPYVPTVCNVLQMVDIDGNLAAGAEWLTG